MRCARLIAIFAVAVLTVCLLWYRFSLHRRERSQDGPIRAAAARYGVDPAIVKAIVWRESRFDPWVRGSAGEIGLMQIREDAAQEWADAEKVDTFQHEHCFNPVTNTLAATWYLRKLLKRYARADDPLPYALADYNAGRGNVLKWISGAAATNSASFIRQIGFPGTRSYVTEVTRRAARYRPWISLNRSKALSTSPVVAGGFSPALHPGLAGECGPAAPRSNRSGQMATGFGNRPSS